MSHCFFAPCRVVCVVGWLWQAWVMELVFTFGLLFVMHVSTPGRFTKDHGGIAVAMLIIGASFAAANISGGIFNPAVALGVCIAFDRMHIYWIYLVRPHGV